MATLIQTTRGWIDKDLLEKREWWNGRETTVEYYKDGVLVHRSVEVRLEGMQVAGSAKQL